MKLLPTDPTGHCDGRPSVKMYWAALDRAMVALHRPLLPEVRMASTWGSSIAPSGSLQLALPKQSTYKEICFS